eukprot:15999701-Heterocapsa_arctica.AAC.1
MPSRRPEMSAMVSFLIATLTPPRGFAENVPPIQSTAWPRCALAKARLNPRARHARTMHATIKFRAPGDPRIATI